STIRHPVDTTSNRGDLTSTRSVAAGIPNEVFEVRGRITWRWMMNSIFVKYVLPVTAVLMLAFGFYHVVHSQPPQEKLPPPARPARSPFPNTIAAAGIVEARSENIAVGAAIPGIVLQTWITPDDVGQYVSQGTPLFRVDDRHLRAQLAMQRAN